MDNKTAKEVKMSESEKNTPQQQKLSYEELNQACAEMSQQIQQQDKYIQQMHTRMQEMSFILQNKRLDYLFRVIETALKCNNSIYTNFTNEFVDTCIKEVQESMTIAKTEKEENSKED